MIDAEFPTKEQIVYALDALRHGQKETGLTDVQQRLLLYWLEQMNAQEDIHILAKQLYAYIEQKKKRKNEQMDIYATMGTRTNLSSACDAFLF